MFKNKAIKTFLWLITNYEFVWRKKKIIKRLTKEL